MIFRRDSFITHRAFCDALAEESSRTVIPQATQPNSHHNMNNLQTQDIQGFTLKKEHQSFNMLRPEQEVQIPSWLCQSNIDLSSNYSRLNQDPHLYENPNPRNGPTLPSYQPSSAASPHMSATALLQKAAQMGATSSSQSMMSGTHQQGHVSIVDSATNNMISSNGNFSLNLSSCEDQMINNSFTSSGFHGTSFEDTFAGNILHSNQEHNINHDGNNDITKTATNDGAGAGTEGNNAYTRDFLGLRPLSDSDILTIAGMGSCMNSSNSDHQENQSQKPWEGN